MSTTALPGRVLRRSAAIGFFLAASCTDTENDRSLTAPVAPVPAEVVSAYDILKMSGPVTLDGNLSEWAGIPTITFQDDPGNGRGALNNAASARLAWDATYLYVAYDVSDTELLANQTTRDATDLYKDDEVELFLDPQGDGGAVMQPTDYQLLANVRDAVMDVQGDGAGGKLASFNAPSLQAKAALNGTLNGGSADVGYTIELRVAWSDLGVTAPADGKLMRLDLAVGDKDAATQPVESFDWAALTSTYNTPNGWKGVRLVVDATAPAAPTNPALAVVSPSAITFSWAGSSSSDVARYRVYRGTSPTLSLVATVAGSPFNDTQLQPSTTYTYQVSAVDAAGNESARTTPMSATTQGSGGIPYGPFGLWQSYTTVYFGPAPFTASIGANAPGGIVTQINAARNMGLRLVLCLAGCAHAPVTTDGKFDLTKWKTLVSSYNTPAIRTAVDSAVADGTVIGNSLIDEPEHPSWGNVPTKPMLDEMATHAKAIFPTLPMGVQFGGQASYTWRTAERFHVVDFTINQYSWRLFSGDAASYRARVLDQAALEGVTPAFSLNILAGGVPDNDGVYDCTGAGQGGIGVNGTNCRMTAAQVRDFGRALGPSGCVLTMWTYDATFFGRADNQQAFSDVASTLGATQPRSCRRPV